MTDERPLSSTERVVIASCILLLAWGVWACPTSAQEPLPQAPQPPTYVRHVDPWQGDDSTITDPNPVRPGDPVIIEWDHACAHCHFHLIVDGKAPILVENNNTMFYDYRWEPGELPVGLHTVEVHVIGPSPCPPPSVRPWGCGRYFAFTTYDPSTFQPPTNLRLVDCAGASSRRASAAGSAGCPGLRGSLARSDVPD